jgi:hypothetical protein
MTQRSDRDRPQLANDSLSTSMHQEVLRANTTKPATGARERSLSTTHHLNSLGAKPSKESSPQGAQAVQPRDNKGS